VVMKTNAVQQVSLLSEIPRPIFISVGSLIPRKNMKVLVEAFNVFSKASSGSLVILGGGPEMEKLRSVSCRSIFLQGNVDNVRDYLAGCDYFVSTSLAEGLPNTVLEALAMGLPAILSD